MASAWGTRQTTTLRTPGGRPASTKISPMNRAMSGVVVDGRKTTALPPVRALRMSQTGVRKGKFPGGTVHPFSQCAARGALAAAPGQDFLGPLEDGPLLPGVEPAPSWKGVLGRE